MPDRKTTIVTHSGNFHTDDIFAVAVLTLVLGEENIEVIRSREDSIINSADYTVDVGGIYDPDKNRFDHHQIEGAGTRENSIPYASFGLVWKKFGEQLGGSVKVFEKIDQMLVQPIDAPDTGVKFLESKIPN